jgi:DNA polymerase elongation subunit (family B)
VLTPTPGIYTEDPVIVLDYSSLYPSSMISENISHDSIVLDSKYDNLPEYEYVDITYDVFEGKGDKKKKVGESTCRFAQFPDKNKGVLPRILQKLLEQRKNTRKRMKEVKIILNTGDIIEGLIISKTEDTVTIKTKEQTELLIDKSLIVSQEDLYNDFEKAVLEGLQLAYKVTANSLYGQVGAKTSPIFLKELAASTTATGRNLIMTAKKFAEDNFDVKVIYGDSVPFDEPIIIRNIENGLIDVKSISDITNNWESYEDFKNSNFVVELRFILNKILIDGTETEDECINLTKSIPKWLRKKAIENKELILSEFSRWKWVTNVSSKDKVLLEIENIKELFEKDTTNRFDKQQALVNYEVWTDNGWQKILRLIRHKTEKKIYRINTGFGVVDVTEDHSLCDINKLPVKPNEIEIKKTELLHSNVMDINFDILENNIPMVIKYPDEYWGETNEKHKDISGDLYECITCHNEYDGTMYYWSKVKRKTEDKEKIVRGNQCKLCKKAKQCSTKGKEFNGKLNKEVMNINKPSYILSKDEAWVWGFFLGDGSCGRYECDSGTKNSWALNNQDIERLNHAKEILERIEGFEFKRLETLESSGVYKLVPHGSIIYMVQKYRKLMYDNLRQKKVPELILNAPYVIRKAFFDGYYEADGTKTNSGKKLYSRDKNWNNIYKKVDFTSKGKSTAQQLYLLARSLGFDLQVKRWKEKDRIYTMRTSTQFTNKLIKTNEEVFNHSMCDGYVYDIETVTGRFTSGVGSITLYQTDSVFLVKDGISKKYKNDKRGILLEAMSIGNAISEAYQKVVKEPHSLCYEKCLYPFIIFSKKRYVGNLYENDPDKYYRKVMGLSLKRRDFANISKIVYGGVIDIILKTNDINESLKYFHKCIQDILDGKYPLEDFILTKTLKGQYKTPDKIVHKVLADRMASRDKGSAPQTNDRVPFIYIMKKEKRGQKLLQGDKVEDPKYIIENKLQIDYEFYITNQIMNSVIQLYSLVIEKLPKYKLPQDYFIKMENKLRLDIKNDNKKVETKLNILKEKEVKKLLFDPYIDKLYSKKNNMREITDFLILNKN